LILAAITAVLGLIDEAVFAVFVLYAQKILGLRDFGCGPLLAVGAAGGIVGSSEVNGSWKIIAIFAPLMWRMRFSESSRRSSPSKTMSPPLTMEFDSGLMRIMLLAATDFPEPDSPTMASVSPCRRSKDAPRTVCTSPA
jgi:hypothetical protein